MSGFRRLLAAGAAGVGLALASAAAAQAESAAVRLVAPRAGDALFAGSTAELEWEGSGLPARLTEWEAFLSLDGGETYPVRITPHLDRDLRRVRWQVPGVPASEARLLLRLGDERRETYYELPQRFSIAAAPGAAWAFALASTAAAPGEPALPGHAGVVAWVEGSRRGGSLRQMVAPERPSWRGAFRPPDDYPQAAVLDSKAPVHPPAPARRGAGEIALAGREASSRERAPAPPLPSDILLLTRRQNE